MNRNLIIGLVLVALVAVGLATRRAPVATSGDAAIDNLAAPIGSAPAVLITYSDKGFTPSVLKIKHGTAIRILNTSGKALRVAPHTDASFSTNPSRELTASKSIKIGEAFETSILTAGVWGYTNYNSQGDVGILIVE